MSNQRDSERRVVITGIGVMSPIGIALESFRTNLLEGRSGIGPIQALAYSPVPQAVAGEVREFNDKTVNKLVKQRKSIKVMCREIQLGVASASCALEHAGIGDGTVDPERLGVDFGANLMLSPPEDIANACFACIDETSQKFTYSDWGKKGLSAMFPLWLLKYLPNMPACHIGISADARGPNNSITLDEASGNLVVGEALRVIARGHADVMIAGATGTRLHAVQSIHARMWETLATEFNDPTEACRPFDLARSGQVIGEGACTLILEEEEHARRRGVPILGGVLGAGSSCVANRDGQPDLKRAMVQAMRGALADARLQPTDIGHINAHGLSTPDTDRLEAAAIQEVFGDFARDVPVTALKSYMGNAASGAGALELAGSLVALQQGVVPPTLNYRTPDPDCPLNVVTGKPLAVSNRTFLKVSVTKMGQASAVVVYGATA